MQQKCKFSVGLVVPGVVDECAERRAVSPGPKSLEMQENRTRGGCRCFKFPQSGFCQLTWILGQGNPWITQRKGHTPLQNFFQGHFWVMIHGVHRSHRLYFSVLLLCSDSIFVYGKEKEMKKTPKNHWSRKLQSLGAKAVPEGRAAAGNEALG